MSKLPFDFLHETDKDGNLTTLVGSDASWAGRIPALHAIYWSEHGYIGNVMVHADGRIEAESPHFNTHLPFTDKAEAIRWLIAIQTEASSK